MGTVTVEGETLTVSGAPATITLPVVTISEPHRLANGKWRVEVHCSDRPTVTYRKLGDTPEEATSKAREAEQRHYAAFLKSLAAPFARKAGRIRQVRNANSGAALGQEAR